jgi:quinol monooxygenase YgiN
MSLTINIYYKGENGNARRFAEEMSSSGLVDEIRAKEGNERYEYYFPMDDVETVLLIDQWRDQKALDEHHASDIMGRIMELRNKYDLHMIVERFIPAEGIDEDDKYVKR